MSINELLHINKKIYINGVFATRFDIEELINRVFCGLEIACIKNPFENVIDIHTVEYGRSI